MTDLKALLAQPERLTAPLKTSAFHPKRLARAVAELPERETTAPAPSPSCPNARRRLGDADLLRNCAMAKDGAVRNPTIFAQSISVRERLISSALKTLEAVYDLRYAEQFFTAVTDEVAAESPAAAGRIIARLSLLNAERGIAFNRSACT